jgi:hypothetical protein
MEKSPTPTPTHFRETLVLLIASKPIHSTFALSQALQAGSFPSHFCFLLLHRVQLEMALATLYCVGSSGPGVGVGVSLVDVREGGFGRGGAGGAKVEEGG